MEYKQATVKDALLLAQVRQKAWAFTYRGIYPDSVIDDFDYAWHTARGEKNLQNPLYYSYFVMEDGVCRGYFSYYFSKDPIWRDFHCRLLSLYLLPEIQGKGLGKDILNFVRKACFAAGYDRFFLSCSNWNTRAMGFYRHMGGSVVAEDVGHENLQEDQVEFAFSCITCRKAEITDARKIVEVRRVIWGETYRGIYPDEMLDDYDLDASEARFAARIADPAHQVYLYLDGEECVGYYATGPSNFGPYKDFDLCLNNLYIRKEYKGRGLGKRAFQMIREYCRKQGIEKFFCGCNYHNTPAMQFYAHMGGVLGDEVAFHESKADDIVHFEFFIR